jgi:hypothetical protein
MPEIELAVAKPIEVSKKFHLLDVADSSHGLHAAGIAATHAAQVLAFDNLDDDSLPDVRKTPSPAKMVEKRVSLPPSVYDNYLQVLPGLRPRWISY